LAADKSAAMHTLLGALNAPYPSPDVDRPHPIDLPHASRMYKTLLQGGHFDHASKAVARAPGFSPAAFAAAFVAAFEEEDEGKARVLEMARGDGAFVLAELCERVRVEGSKAEKKAVSAWFGERERMAVDESEAKGKKVLLDKINALRAAS
jgi:pumilio homology domain family member 6